MKNTYSVIATDKKGNREYIVETKSKAFAELTAKRAKEEGCTKIIIDSFDEDGDLIEYKQIN